MIRRISEICNVGNFYDFKTGGACQFEKMTIIYGLNTYGKSTMVDIFNSLSLNDPSSILNRKSIGSPNIGNPRVIMKIFDDGDKEKTITFNNSVWQGFQKDYDI